MKRRLAATARGRAVEALRDVLERGERAAPRLASRARGLSEPDADLLRELVLGVLRWKDSLDDEIAGVSRVRLPKLAPNLREILEVALYQTRHLDRIPAYAAVNEAVDLARGSGGDGAARLVNGVLRTILKGPAPEPPRRREAGGGRQTTELARFYSHPVFLVERWIERFGLEQTRAILEADNAVPRLDLVANPRRGTRSETRAALAAEGVVAEPSPVVPLALTVVSGHPLRSPLFARGAFAVQDVGSQLLPLLLPPGETLVDLAAAPGGKSISALAHGRVRATIAVDRSWGRLRRVAENAARLGMPEMRPVGGDVGAAPLPAEAFDRVLFDAPCSGTGTLRKNPEIRYRITPAAIERLAAAQAASLEAAARLLRPGGFLLYSTCSLEEEENETVVERVIAARPELERAAIEPPAELGDRVSGDRLRLFPDASTDGFTAHLLRRRA